MISVIIPLYNKELIVERSVRSVLTQSFRDIELIVVDDGSTDRSLSVVQAVKDPRLRIIRQENGGPSKARNTGTRNARGEWILFLDADDELLPGALETYGQLIVEHSDADIIDCGQMVRRGTEQHLVGHSLHGYSKNTMRDWFYGKIGPGSNHSVFKRSLVKAFPYSPHYRRFEDADLLVRMLPSARVYSTPVTTSLVNAEFSAASRQRKNIDDDYVGHLTMRGAGFWATMCIYKLYLENRELYPEQMRRLYPTWRYRYDLLLLYKLLMRLRDRL